MTKYDLALGDWVRIGKDCEPTKVTELAHDYVRVAGMFSDQAYGHVNPIPITPEILEKNGFKEEKSRLGCCIWESFISTDVLGIEHIDSITLRPLKYNNKHEWAMDFSFYAEGSGRFFIDYVHELQHALRLCKIDKEIEL